MLVLHWRHTTKDHHSETANHFRLETIVYSFSNKYKLNTAFIFFISVALSHPGETFRFSGDKGKSVITGQVESGPSTCRPTRGSSRRLISCDGKQTDEWRRDKRGGSRRSRAEECLRKAESRWLGSHRTGSPHPARASAICSLFGFIQATHQLVCHSVASSYPRSRQKATIQDFNGKYGSHHCNLQTATQLLRINRR